MCTLHPSKILQCKVVLDYGCFFNNFFVIGFYSVIFRTLYQLMCLLNNSIHTHSVRNPDDRSLNCCDGSISTPLSLSIFMHSLRLFTNILLFSMLIFFIPHDLETLSSLVVRSSSYASIPVIISVSSANHRLYRGHPQINIDVLWS